MTRRQKKTLGRILVTGALMLGISLLPISGIPRFLLYLLPYLLIGYDVLYDAAFGIANGQVFDENFLMAVATLGAMVLGVTYTGDYTEAVAVMLFYQIGELFQSIAVGKSRKSIQALMDIRPDYAYVLTDGQPVQTDPELVQTGSVILVRPGEKIPIDGTVTYGRSSLNTAALTGESIPLDVGPGNQVISGCINLSGVLHIRTTRPFAESTVSKILELVENAAANKSRSEAFISRFARIYTPAVCISALALLVFPPIVAMLLGNNPMWGQWLYRSLSFLVASCPCALVISVPLSFFASIGCASRAGILIKGSNHLETLANVRTFVFDKTGTLTTGAFQVTKIAPLTGSSAELLDLAAHADLHTSHPVGKALRQALSTPLKAERVSQVQELQGLGVTAYVDNRQVAVGNRDLLARLNISCPHLEDVGTVVYIAVDGSYAGYLLLSDLIKPTAREAIEALTAAGITQTVMLTGDSEAAAALTASQLGIPQHFSRLLPGDKVEKLEQILQCQSKGAATAFVGDGINDAPVLARADVGIAMGALGSDAAMEAADIVLMDDDPRKIAVAMAICRKCLGIVRENIVFSITVKVIALVLVAMGIASMWLAVFADVGVMVLAVLNSIRALFYKVK